MGWKPSLNIKSAIRITAGEGHLCKRCDDVTVQSREGRLQRDAAERDFGGTSLKWQMWLETWGVGLGERDDKQQLEV